MAWLSEWYLWIKALHIVAVISWMAGLLYLPRLFVYHTQVAADSPSSALFKVMERRLLWAIMHPAMVVALATGLAILATPGLGLWAEPWMWAKLALVGGLVAAHKLMGDWMADFAQDRNRRRTVFFRVANEVPTLLMIGIVILVIVRPF